jgi:hypothetical protein
MPIVTHYFSTIVLGIHTVAALVGREQFRYREERVVSFLMVFIAILVAGMNKSFRRSIFMTYLIKNRYPSSTGSMQADNDEGTTARSGKCADWPCRPGV